MLEKEAHLGGALTMAAAAPFKADMRNYLDWAIRTTLKTAGLTVKLSTPATPARIKAEKPDVLIIAVGSAPIIPTLPGIRGRNVVWAGDVELGKVPTGDTVVVVGAGLTGSETALHLAQQGKKVTLIDMLPLEEIETGASVINMLILRKMLQEINVDTQTGLTLKAVTKSGVEVTDNHSNKVRLPCQTVVLALGVEPRLNLIEKFKGLAPEVHVVGDVNNPRGNLLKAVSEGFFAAMEL